MSQPFSTGAVITLLACIVGCTAELPPKDATVRFEAARDATRPPRLDGGLGTTRLG